VSSRARCQPTRHRYPSRRGTTSVAHTDSALRLPPTGMSPVRLAATPTAPLAARPPLRHPRRPAGSGPSTRQSTTSSSSTQAKPPRLHSCCGKECLGVSDKAASTAEPKGAPARVLTPLPKAPGRPRQTFRTHACRACRPANADRAHRRHSRTRGNGVDARGQLLRRQPRI